MKRYITTIACATLLAGTALADDYPKFETFLGYNYVRFYPQSNVPAFSANGGSGQFVVNPKRWLGVVLDVGAVTNQNFAGFSATNTQLFFMGGPRFSLRRSRFKPYFQAVFGGVYYTASSQFTGTLVTPSFPILDGTTVVGEVGNSQTKFAMAAGFGLDIKITRHLAFRPGAIDYYYTRIGNLRDFGDNSQNNLRYSAGINMMFGGEKPAPPPPPAPQTKKCPDGSVVAMTASCPKMNLSLSLSATPAELCPGETAQLNVGTGGASMSQLNFAWTLNGQPYSQDKSGVFTATNPGTYDIALNASGNQFGPAAAHTTIVVKEYVAPTGTVQANPAQINAGDKSSLSANFNGQCGGPIQAPRYMASEGAIEGDQFDSSSLQWDSSNNAEQHKTITITAKASDNKSEGTATTTIDVVKKAMVAPIRLPDVLFAPNSARVNNCGKRVLLEQLRSYYERDNTGTVVLVGHQSASEKASNLSDQRALNAAAVITAGSGVCLSIPQSQVQVSAPGTDQQGVSFDSAFCASSAGGGANVGERRVVVWFVPNGGQMPPSVTDAKAASATSVSSLGCPK
jgi:opacity protein-like surface antigen/outer membrane protein OmpA-like peptidoglycan-associated protein